MVGKRKSSGDAESDSGSEVVSSSQSGTEKSSSDKGSDGDLSSEEESDTTNKAVKIHNAVKKVSPKKEQPIKGRRKRKAGSATSKMLKLAKRLRDMRANETPKQREARLQDMRERARKRLQTETADQRSERLARMRELAKTRITSKVARAKRATES